MYNPERNRTSRVGLAGFFVLLLLGVALTAHRAHSQNVVTGQAVLTTDVSDLASGGLNPGLQMVSNLDLIADWNGANGWEAHLYILGNFGGGFSANRVGDAQVISNIDAVPGGRLFEAYVKHTSNDGRLVNSFGLMNLNAVFDVQKPAKLFLNPSHGIGPDYSQTAPSIFPVSALGMISSFAIRPDLKWRFGLFDGLAGDPAHGKVFVSVELSRSDGAAYIAELEKEFVHGYIKLDHWGYTASRPRIDGLGSESGNNGSFLQAAFSTEANRFETQKGANAWVRAGVAKASLNKIDRYLGYGLTLPGQGSEDQMGIAVAQVHFSPDFQALSPWQGAVETNYELTFSHPLSQRLTLQPDLQFVKHPFGRTDPGDATVFTVRLVYNLLQGN